MVQTEEEQFNKKVFIAGCGRSGTTYLRILLDTHRKIHIPLECLFYSDYILNEQILPKFLIKKLFFKEPMLKAWYSGDEFDFNSVGDLISKVQSFQASKEGAQFWGQKTPRFVRFMKEFNNSILNIQWILIYRDPRAVVNSLLNSKEHSYSIRGAINRWLKDNKEIVKLIKSDEVPSNIHLVKYEDLISNFYPTLNDIFSFLNLESIVKNDLVEKEQSLTNKDITGNNKVKTNTIREGLEPNPNSLNSWKKQLSDDQIKLIQLKCENYMKELNYEKICTQSKKSYNSILIREELKSFPKELLFVWENLFYYPKYFFYYITRKVIISSFKIFRSK